VRDDDLSMGRRLFEHAIPAAGSPWERIARGMIDRSPGATKADAPTDRGGTLVRVAKRAGAKRAVLVLLKFCDPWAWDAPALEARCKAEGVDLLALEIAGGEDLAAGTVANRVEAWFEMDTVGDLFE
jgi:benzoyl-CoA reductase/2-hydroxyglutaryl-CoA dehydratase subunit BcrC/BadD/HgdB